MFFQQSCRHTAPPFPDPVSFPHGGADGLGGVGEALWASCLRKALVLGWNNNGVVEGICKPSRKVFLSKLIPLLGGAFDLCFTMRRM